MPQAATSVEKEESPAADTQLRDLSDDELREMGRRLKVTSWHRMNRDTLIERIEERS